MPETGRQQILTVFLFCHGKEIQPKQYSSKTRTEEDKTIIRMRQEETDRAATKNEKQR